MLSFEANHFRHCRAGSMCFMVTLQFKPDSPGSLLLAPMFCRGDLGLLRMRWRYSTKTGLFPELKPNNLFLRLAAQCVKPRKDLSRDER